MADIDHPARPSAEPISASGPLRLIADRTGVLVVGLAAGFAVGLSFAPAPAPVAVPPVGSADAGGAPTAVTAPAEAPTAAPPVAAAQGLDPRVVARVARTGKIHVGVFGDSFGIGVWDALYRLLPESEGYQVLRFGLEATGFTRYRVMDLAARAKQEVAADPIDVAVISIGVNDAQDMWEGKLYTFMSEDWKRVIGARIDAFVAVARSTGAQVYWVGLPAMRDPALDAKVQALNTFFAARAKALGVPFIPTRARSVDAEGRYASHLPDPVSGTPRLVRTGDGIHMIGIGYQRIVPDVVTRIREYAKRAFAAAHRTPAGEGKGA